MLRGCQIFGGQTWIGELSFYSLIIEKMIYYLKCYTCNTLTSKELTTFLNKTFISNEYIFIICHDHGNADGFDVDQSALILNHEAWE